MSNWRWGMGGNGWEGREGLLFDGIAAATSKWGIFCFARSKRECNLIFRFSARLRQLVVCVRRMRKSCKLLYLRFGLGSILFFDNLCGIKGWLGITTIRISGFCGRARSVSRRRH